MRHKILHNQNVRAEILDMVSDVLEESVLAVCDQRMHTKEWDLDALLKRCAFLFNHEFKLPADLQLSQQSVFDALNASAKDLYNTRVAEIDAKLLLFGQMQGEILGPLAQDMFGGEIETFDFSSVERESFLSVLDHYWNLHLQEMDHLREGIGLRGYGQKNPLHEYQREGFLLFQHSIETVKENLIRRLYYYEVPSAEELRAHLEAEKERREKIAKRLQMVHQSGAQPQEQESAEDLRSPQDERAKLLAQRKARRKVRR